MDAFDDAVVRIRKKGGLFIKDYRKGMFRKALIRLSRDTLSVLGKRRDRQKLHDRLAAEGLLLQGGPSRSPGLSDEEIALRGLRFRICRELLSGDYRNTDLADKFTPEEEVNAGGGGDGDRIGGEWVGAGCPTLRVSLQNDDISRYVVGKERDAEGRGELFWHGRSVLRCHGEGAIFCKM